jgi:hypothetical protein
LEKNLLGHYRVSIQVHAHDSPSCIFHWKSMYILFLPIAHWRQSNVLLCGVILFPRDAELEALKFM